MQHRAEWIWYIACAMIALAWKYYTYVYIGVRRLRKSFKQCSLEWFELTTIDSRVSWFATIMIVWVIGTIYINGVGIEWLFGGALAGIPVCVPIAGLLGILSEYIAPALLKWLASKIPFMNLGGER